MNSHFRRFSACCIAFVCLFTCALAGGFNSDADAIEKAALSVLKLEVYDAYDQMIGTGSGFVMFDNMTLVTNYHVIEDSTYVYAYSDEGYKYQLDKVLICSSYIDLAILRFSTPTVMQPLPYAETQPKRSEQVVAIGSPMGFKNTISKGNVSGIYQEGDIDYIMFTASISNGSSGGALFNDNGEVIGITSASYQDAQNMNVAIDIRETLELYAAWDGQTALPIRNYEKVDVGNPDAADLFSFMEAEVSLDRRTDKNWVAEVSTQDGVVVSMSDLAEDEYYSPYLMLTNNSTHSVNVDVSAELDDETLTWDNTTIEALDYCSFSLRRDSAPQEGSHTVVWKVNGVEAARFHWTVTNGAVAAQLDNLEVETSLDRCTDNSWIAEVSREDGVVVSENDLAEGEYYSPYLMLTNHDSKSIEVTVSAVLDGEMLGDTQATIESSDYHNFSLSRNLLTPQEGSHTIVWSVNGTEVARFHWTVTKTSAASQFAGLEIETSLDRCTDDDWIAEVSREDGVVVSLNDLGEDEYYSPYLMLTNNGSKSVDVTVSAVLDGEELGDSKATIASGDYHNFSLSRNVMTQEGFHTIIWSINGVEAARFHWTATGTTAGNSTATAAQIDNLEVEISLDRRTDNAWVAEVSREDGVVVSLNDLGKDEFYSPYLMLTNNSSQPVEVKVTADLDGESLSWDKITIDAHDYIASSLRRESASPQEGSHTIKWYVNGQIVGTFSWSAVSDNWLASAEISTSLDIRTAENYIREVTEMSGAVVLYSDLEAGQYYTPYLGITNNSAAAVNAVVTAVIDGEEFEWDERTFNVGETRYSFLREDSAPGKGSHTVIWSVNGEKVATFHWTVK